MAIHFERSAVQEFFERRVGCPAPDDFSQFLDKLSILKLSLSDSAILFDKVMLDAQAQFERCALTLFQALFDLESGNKMWAVVKFYYSVFYAIRAELHLNGLSIIRCNRVFTTDGKAGSSLVRYNNKKERGDHAIAIALMIKYLKDYDIMQAASVDGDNVYTWMKTRREIVQYKMRQPPEIFGYDPFFPRKQMGFVDQVSMFLADSDPYFCFDADYSALAIPIKRFQLTAANAKKHGVHLSKEFSNISSMLIDKSRAAGLLRPYIW